MSASLTKSDRVLAWAPYLSFAGLVSLVANLLLSFEQPHPEWLCGAAVLTCAAPSAMLAHLWMTPELTAKQKQMWIRGLIGRRGAAVFASYFDPQRRLATTRRLADPDVGKA